MMQQSTVSEPVLMNPVATGPAATSVGRDRVRVLGWLIVAITALTSAAMLWSRRDFIPVWDGRIYADCVVNASRNLLDVGGYRCADHISQGYIVFLALAQRLAPASPLPMLLMNVVLLVVGATALYRVLLAVLPSPAHAMGRALVLAAFVIHPIVLASVVQPGLDFGVLVFSLCVLAAVLEGRTAFVVTFGLLLVFSKEPGVLVYAVLAALYLWRVELRRLLPGGAYWISLIALLAALVLNILQLSILSALMCVFVLLLLRYGRPAAIRPPLAQMARALMSHWILALPLVAVATYMLIHSRGAHAAAAGAIASGAPVLWANTGSDKLVATLVRAGVVDPQTRSALALIFIVGFLWIPSAILATDVSVATIRHLRRQPSRALPDVDVAALGIVTAALIGIVWFLTRYQTYSNARYYLPAYPLVLVVAYASLVRLGIGARARAALFGMLVLLLAVSVEHTVDPVSRKLWGTFSVGNRSLLYVTSLTGECCGGGRDQLGYNLEFTKFDVLTSAALAVIKPDNNTVIVMPQPGDWLTVGPLDARTHQRTLARQGTVQPWVLGSREVYQHSSQLFEAWYLEVPYLESSRSLAQLATRYDISAPAWVESDGYAMGVRRIRLRKAAR